MADRIPVVRMVDPRHRQLHEFVEQQAGDAYRAAFHYDEDGIERIHVRDDLPRDRLEEVVPDVYDRVQRTRALLRKEDYPPLGPARATTEVHDDGVVLHFPESEKEGVIVSLDRDVARQLTGFVVRCTSILDSSSGVEYRASGVTD